MGGVRGRCGGGDGRFGEVLEEVCRAVFPLE